MMTLASRPGERGLGLALARWWVAATVALLGGGCSDGTGGSDEQVEKLAGSTMGTTYHVRFGTPLAAKEAADLRERIVARLEEIEASMSTYRPDSEISAFNDSSSRDWFPVSRDLAQVVHVARETGRETNGAFDITIGPLVDLWGFGGASSGQSASVPTEDRIREVQATTGSAHLEVRLDPPALRKRERPELRIDVSGVAKGFGVDAIAELLEDNEIRSYLVEIGGEVRVGDAKPGGGRWRVGIESPVEGKRVVERVLELANISLATSGDYRNFVVIDGTRFSHLVNPRTGRPVEDSGLGSVSVLAPSCQVADAMATALFVLGSEEGKDFAERRKLPALFLIRQKGEFSAMVTHSFREYAGSKWTGE